MADAIDAKLSSVTGCVDGPNPSSPTMFSCGFRNRYAQRPTGDYKARRFRS